MSTRLDSQGLFDRQIVFNFKNICRISNILCSKYLFIIGSYDSYADCINVCYLLQPEEAAIEEPYRSKVKDVACSILGNVCMDTVAREQVSA